MGRRGPRRGQKFRQQGRRAGAVHIVIPENRDLFASLDRLGESIHGAVHVAQRQRFRHQFAQRRIEIGWRVGSADSPARQHSGENVVEPIRLRDRRRPRFSGGVEARLPTPA